MCEIIIIDVEASGLHFDSYPIEVAAMVNGKIKSWLIKPHDSWKYWCKTAERMHGISRAMLAEKGRTPENVAIELEAFIGGANAVTYSDAVAWDSDWMDTLFWVVGKMRRFNILSIHDLLNENQARHFDAAKSQIAASGKYRFHRAKNDVKIICEAYLMALKIN